MHGHISVDTEVGVPAAVVWDVYRGLEQGRLVSKLVPDVLGSVQVLEGDGGVGTLLKVTLAPGGPLKGYFIERVTKVDDENRVKENEIIEGGYKALGFDVFLVRMEILEKDSQSCIIRSSMEYEVDEKLADIVSHVNTDPLKIMAEAIGKHLCDEKKTGQ
ncbi:hypothetical protein PTKIN_Ptkin01aG0402800 [Pterospermum kingtungense]